MKKIGFDTKDWELYATCYDSLNYLTPYQQLQEVVIEELGILNNQSILDAGCGTGNSTQRIIQKYPNSKIKIWAIDSSREMLNRARVKCVEFPVNFIQTDINQPLSFPNNFFDKIISVNNLYALNNPKETLREFFRVLKPGGQLILVTPKKGYQNGLILKKHCESKKPDEYWLDAHRSPSREKELIAEAIMDKKIASQMMLVAEYNRKIVTTGTFHFFESVELKELIKICGLKVIKTTSTYADQGILITATKEV